MLVTFRVLFPKPLRSWPSPLRGSLPPGGVDQGLERPTGPRLGGRLVQESMNVKVRQHHAVNVMRELFWRIAGVLGPVWSMRRIPTALQPVDQRAYLWKPDG
jgi:hypothetical protein